MDSEEKKSVEKALNRLDILRKARIPEIPPLYEQMVKDSPLVTTSEGIKRPLVDLLSYVVVTGGVKQLKDALKDAGQVTLDELAQLCELSVQPVRFSERDVEIIQLLYQDPLMSRAQIGKELGLHRSTVAHRLIRLIWTDTIRSYPLPDWHHFGIARLGFLYNCSKLPEIIEPRHYSRYGRILPTTGFDVLDNWSCPMEEIPNLRDEYLSLQDQGAISDLEIREYLGLERSYSLAFLLGKPPSLPHIGLEMKRRLNGRTNYGMNQEMVLRQEMSYHHAPSHDAFDVELLEILRTGFFMDPLTRSKVAEMLNTSVSKVTRRVARWQKDKIVIPMLRIGLVAGLVRQGPILLNIELTADIKMKKRLYSILEFFPMAFLYEVRVGRRKELVCHLSVPPEMVDLVRQLPAAAGVGNGYRYETLRVPSAEGLFKTFNKRTNTWEPLQQVFKERPH
ncbi:MAG: hypothetical protein ACXADX_09390 [Candidatus Hodarchaeales archaeon]|jgi:DNA-binding Lrp family transcriptional regulator